MPEIEILYLVEKSELCDYAPEFEDWSSYESFVSGVYW
jgi:hypothetical protein